MCTDISKLPTEIVAYDLHPFALIKLRSLNKFYNDSFCAEFIMRQLTDDHIHLACKTADFFVLNFYFNNLEAISKYERVKHLMGMSYCLQYYNTVIFLTDKILRFTDSYRSDIQAIVNNALTMNAPCAENMTKMCASFGIVAQYEWDVPTGY